MLRKSEIKKIINSVDKKELSKEIIEVALNWRRWNHPYDYATIYAELDLETGEIEVNTRADFELIPKKEKGLWIAQFTTYNMEEIPDDLPEEIKNTEDTIAEFYRLFPEHYIDFFDDYEIENKLKELIN